MIEYNYGPAKQQALNIITWNHGWGLKRNNGVMDLQLELRKIFSGLNM